MRLGCQALPTLTPTSRGLDETGLYYYGARYYDATIGRFISADSIVPNPTNPQIFNRYSYCLNNPLKYIDPLGYWGEKLGDPYAEGALGWTSEEGFLMGVGGEWVPISDETVNFFVDAFANSDATWSEFMSGMSPFLEDAGYSLKDPASMWPLNSFVLDGELYIWNYFEQYNLAKDLAGEWPYDLQLTVIACPDMTTHDWIILCDSLAVAGDAAFLFGPIPGGIGWLVSGIAGTTSFILTAQEAKHGRATDQDVALALTTASTGWIPFYGLASSSGQLAKDIFSSRR